MLYSRTADNHPQPAVRTDNMEISSKEDSTSATLNGDYADALARFRFALGDHGASALTVKTYMLGAGKFLRFLEHDMGLVVPLDKVTKEHAREWLRSLREAGLKGVTVRSNYQAARQMFKRAMEDGEVRENPFDGLPLPPAEMPEPTIISPSEVQAMVDAAKRDRVGFLWGKRDAAIILLLYDTGLRAAELLAFREQDIDWQTGAVTVMGKGRRQRIVGLGATAMRAFNRYLHARKRYEASRKYWQQQADDASVWISRKGGTLTASGLKTLLQRRAEEGRVRKHIHPHAFRHSAATSMAAEMPESELRAHFGWSPNSPQVYRYTRSNLTQRAILRHRKNAPGDKIRL